MNGAKKLYVKSFGCQMNVYDSQRMADTLAPEGYVETATGDDADLIIAGVLRGTVDSGAGRGARRGSGRGPCRRRARQHPLVRHQ